MRDDMSPSAADIKRLDPSPAAELRGLKGILAEIPASIKLTAPMAVALLAEIGQAVVHVAILGGVSAEYLAAGTLGLQMIWVPQIVAIGIINASGAVAAQAYGAGNRDKIESTVRQALRLGFFLSLIAMAGAAAAPTFLRLLGYDAAFVALLSEFLYVALPTIMLGMGYHALRNMAQALGRPVVITAIAVIAVAVRGLSCYGLVNGAWGLPKLGMAGAGVAALLTHSVELGVAIFWVRRSALFRTYRPLTDLLRADWPVMREIFQVGWPIGVIFLAENLLFTVTGLLAQALGTAVGAGHQAVLSICSVTFMIPLAASQIATIRVGHHIGAGRIQAARAAGFAGIIIAEAFMVLSGITLAALPETLLSFYLDLSDPQNQAAIVVALSIFPIAAIFQIVDGAQVAAAGSLRGLKDTRWPMIIGLIGYWGIGVPAGIGMGFGLGWGIEGLWWGLAAGLAASAVLLTLRYDVRSRRGVAVPVLA